MTVLLLLLVFLALAAGVGRRLLDALGAALTDRLERWVVSVALGLGVMAYVVLALGLAGFLSRLPVAIGLLGLAAVCWPGFLALARDLRRTAEQGNRGTGEADRPGPPAAISWVAAGALLLMAAIVVINCFVPPGGHEWDALSYHLAAPRVYIEHQRIVFLPTDHHSNFPFLVEMLFTLGLLYQGWALANLFHFAAAVLCVGGTIAIGRRLFPGAGLVGALVFGTTPMVIWEAGAAYIEMGLTLYVLLAVGAAIGWRQTRDPRLLTLAGVLMGFALAVKALALAPFALLTLLLLAARAPWRPLLAYVGCAVVVGCPFYIKSAVWTGNPVYPYAYRLLGGRYWNQQMADAYSGEQRGFGMSHVLMSASGDARGIRPEYEDPTLIDRVRNLLLTPFELVAIPRIYYNYNDPGVFSQLGFLFLALPPLLLLASGVSAGSRWCAALAALWYCVWALTMQYSRYIIPLLPLLGLVGGEGVWRMARRQRWLGWLAGGAVALQYGLALSYFGPRLFENRLPGSSTPLPGQWELATSAEARDTFLTRAVNIYGAEQWLNTATPRDAGVILFEETRGFYLDRPYLWGNSPHSLYIPYHTFQTGQEMVDWFLDHGYRYALVNLRYAPQATQSVEGAEILGAAVREGTMGDLVRQWYRPDLGGEPWRRLLGEALQTGAAVYVPEASSRAAVVLEFVRLAARPGR